MAEQAKFAYSLFKKSFRKASKMDQGKKQIKATVDHGQQLVELMNLLKRIPISIEVSYHLKNKKIINKLVEERCSEFWDLEKNN